jgi:uncharacterized protein YbjT (DUF2867 family)
LDTAIHMVTGAYGYSGSYIARRLLAQGCAVRTLTNSPERTSPLRDRIGACPFSFDNMDVLIEALRGTDVLYNTYWVRFNADRFSYAQAVRNSESLFKAAWEAGVGRVVHTSITNPSANSPYEYFRGKAQVEEALKKTGVSYAILRPAVFFGGHDILVNNLAWMLRRLPVFGVFGRGAYRLQPIHVDDFAVLAVEHGRGAANVIVNAIGPETFTYRELVQTIARTIGVRRPIVPVPPSIAYWSARALGLCLGDITLTRDEIGALMDELLYVDGVPTGRTSLRAWAQRHAHDLGRTYASELRRRRNRAAAYG